MNVFEKIDNAVGVWVNKGVTPSHIVVHKSAISPKDLSRLGDTIVDKSGHSIDILISNHDHIRYGEVFCASVIQNMEKKTLWGRIKEVFRG